MTSQIGANSSLPSYSDIAGEITKISLNLHANKLIGNAQANNKFIENSIRDVKKSSSDKAIIISAGPSVHRKKSIEKILDSKFKGAIVAVDGSYLACIKAGLVPDYVLTLDPHPTRIVRWFGDPNFQINSNNDDYFSRQDLDISFRNNLAEQNLQNIQFVNEWAKHSDLVISSSSPSNVVDRVLTAQFRRYFWWNPLVDDPKEDSSISRKLFNINKLPCMNTGGNVGTAAWVFASTTLGIQNIAMVGMDFGYYADLPYSETQKYYELLERLNGNETIISEYFPSCIYPETNESFYTDATYSWYKSNFLELAKIGSVNTFNCTEGGTLFGPGVHCISLNQFLKT